MTEQTLQRKRRPAIAALLALAAPGLGHLYCGKLMPAIGSVLAAIVYANIFFLLLVYQDAQPSHLLAYLIAGLLVYLLQVGHVCRTARRQSVDLTLRPYNQWYYYAIWWLSVATIGFMTGSTFSDYRTYHTPSTSMENALLYNDRFVVDLSAYRSVDPARGDIAIFLCPRDGTTLYLKRCIAVPGDTVEIVGKRLFLNGAAAREPLTIQFTDLTSTGEPRIHAKLPGGIDSRDNYGPHVVPAGQFFMMGDNRDNSLDSRYWGFVPKELILGKVIRITYSSKLSRMGSLVQ